MCWVVYRVQTYFGVPLLYVVDKKYLQIITIENGKNIFSKT